MLSGVCGVKTVIVGAGICGLVLGRELQSRGHNVVIVEKSKGVGGRLATRRTEAGKFDHGAQFYTKTESLAGLHEEWVAAGISRVWHRYEDPRGELIERFIAPNGMTDFAKHLLNSKTEKLSVLLEHKAVGIDRMMIRKQGETLGSWSLQLEERASLACDRLILTSPLPQTLELLVKSQIDFPEELKSVSYAKALVLLIEGVQSNTNALSAGGYSENLSNDVFSISNQRSKGLNTKEAWTVVMSPSFSHAWFEKTDDEILEQAVIAMKQAVGEVSWEAIQLKKWRYSHPVSSHLAGMFYELPGSLYLAGDAFGGGSIGRTVGSALALLKHLT